MALQAHAVACNTEFGGMGLVAIAAGHAGREHLALLERAVIVDLVEHLPVGMIETAGERRNRVRVGQRSSGEPSLGKLAAPGVAQPAGLDFYTQRARCAAADSI